ncbi:putative tRNA methyltransferase complex subunit Cpd1 [Paratrimastix pyriformis]|uniref:tRNA (adenine(58)-N(1))-methyltransferase n=1 Tax=Paratrimastix pyriformis TaxID=342808 RepID=A0ABQ8U6I9_9EUKA|nr:putative tRNA methyltransferase complex subunit Cpd1 [Paratrimastix pyriformis]
MAEEDFTKEGDNVILYEGLDKMQALKLKHGEIHQNRFGAFYHDDIIGKLWGSKIVARKSRGFTYVLRPIPELWAICCFHRTQILFSTDISAICLGLDLNPGRVVVEAGTGSGVLSHAMARCVAPTGHLFTFEFHRKRAEAAAQDFLDHGFSPFITVTHRDVGMEGFKKPRAGNPMIVKAPVTATSLPPPFCPLAAPGTSRMPPDEQEDAFADGVFLDLPNPHDAVRLFPHIPTRNG